jgi:hypothetical protein
MYARLSGLVAIAALLAVNAGTLRARVSGEVADDAPHAGSTPPAAAASGPAPGAAVAPPGPTEVELPTASDDGGAAEYEYFDSRWEAHDIALGEGDEREIRMQATEPALGEDLAMLRAGKPHEGFEISWMTTLRPSADARGTIAVLEGYTPPSWVDARFPTHAGLVAWVRSPGLADWRIALVVPFIRSRWKGPWPRAEDRTLPFRAALPIESLGDARPIVRIVAVPLRRARSIVCAGLGARADLGLPADQLCVVVRDARPRDPRLLGRLRGAS